jgi:hypothetical protein
MKKTKTVVKTIKGYTFKRGPLKGKRVKPYKRRVRKKPKKVFISPEPKVLYPVYDEYHQFRGWSSKPPKGAKRKRR